MFVDVERSAATRLETVPLRNKNCWGDWCSEGLTAQLTLQSTQLQSLMHIARLEVCGDSIECLIHWLWAEAAAAATHA